MFVGFLALVTSSSSPSDSRNNKKKSEEKKRKTVTHRAMKLLGSLGGRSHALVSAKSSNTHVVWDTEQKVKFPLPLAQLKMDILFDHMLPRVTYLAENSTHR